MTDLATLTAAKTVDARAMSCPGPLLEAKKSIGSVQIGEVLEIWAGDAQTKNDMPRWCKKVGHEYLGDLVADGYERLFLKRLK
ncbi:MAG: sulfurtransferase TusA family protein [Anaerolineae bacterium]|jgi:tRNA 2-thiouridine synthesizing protein A|nr:sulfurtransferase TusA family protein [Anaerolineae bacterium]MBT7074035.1 sulfurtransferase TusA family protein [Anaerolineae bacterium]